MTNHDMRPIPESVARALATLTLPSPSLPEFIRAYGPDRGAFEWEGSTLAAQEARRKEEAEGLLKRARELASFMGWDWREIEAAAREDHPEVFKEEHGQEDRSR